MGERKRDREAGRGRTGGRDRAAGRALPLGWGDGAATVDPSGPGSAGRTVPTDSRGPTDPTDLPHPADSPRPLDPTAKPGPHHRSSPPRLSSRSRRLLAIGGVLALVAALFVGLPRLLSSTAGPERATGEFLHAVIDGDVETVLAHVEDAPDASAAALTAQVLAEAHDQLESFEIQHVEVTSDTARVTVALNTGTARSEATFTLTATDAGPFSPLAWELAPVALPEFVIDVPFGAQEVGINGVSFPVAELGLTGVPYESRITVQLLPGTYEISLPESRRWLEAEPIALEAPPAFRTWRKPVHGLQHTLAEDGLQEVQHQIDAALEECATDTSSAPEGCPFAVPDPSKPAAPEPAASEPDGPEGPSTNTASQGTWTLTDPPRVEVHPGDSFLWMVHGEGTAEFTPDDLSAEDPATDRGVQDEAGAAAAITVPFEVDGTVTIDGDGELAVALRSTASFSYAYCVDEETGHFDGVVVIDDAEVTSSSWDACG